VKTNLRVDKVTDKITIFCAIATCVKNAVIEITQLRLEVVTDIILAGVDSTDQCEALASNFDT
jgi:hypothetical protein